MITRRQMMKAFALSSLVATPAFLERIAAAAPEGLAAATPAAAAPANGVVIRQIMAQPLPSLSNHVGAVVTVDFAPGASSLPHLHPGPVFGYVLEGTIAIGVDPIGPITYKAGDVWYEPPRHTHRVARNPSATEPARILAFLIVKKGESLVEPPASR